MGGIVLKPIHQTSERVVMTKHSTVWKQMKKNYSAYLFLLPKLLLFIAFVAIPVVWAFIISFQEYKIFGSEWAGLNNYMKVFKSGAFYDALGNTFLFTVVTVPFNVISALIIASLIHPLGKLSQSFF